MAVYFDVAVATDQRCQAEAVARHLADLEFLGAEPAVFQGAGAGWWTTAWLRGLSISAPRDPEPPMDEVEPEAARRLRAVYDKLLTAPPFRLAHCGTEVGDRLTDEDDATFAHGCLLFDDDVADEVGVVLDADLHAALGAPADLAPLTGDRWWRPYLTRTPFAYAFLANRIATPTVDVVGVEEISWSESPTGTELERLRFDDGLTLYLHPRSGRWSRLAARGTRGAAFLGVLRDALVFAMPPTNRLARLFEPSPVDEVIETLHDPLAGSAVRRTDRVATWGPFCDRVRDDCVEQLRAAVPDAVTYVLDALEAPVDGLRHTVIVHHPARRE